ncbi:MAG: ABC transporter ATP-binding protein [Desulfitobacteriia bacterium]|jgi:Fe-S cluster assembly ATP-binding protein
MLELKNISFSVEKDGKKKEIIKDISLKIEDKFVAITGPNGSGKSTLAKLILGIEKPTAGKIFFEGKDITGMSITERAKSGISYAFQQPVKFKGIKVRDLISLAAGKELTKEEVCVYLSEVGLCALEYINREVDGSLSGGELKRIEIAALLARRTKLSILDEPEAGIDLWSFQNLIKVFKDLQKATKGTILIISHQEKILNIVDKIVVLEAGQIKHMGSKEEVLPDLTLEPQDCKQSCEHFAM